MIKSLNLPRYFSGMLIFYLYKFGAYAYYMHFVSVFVFLFGDLMGIGVFSTRFWNRNGSKTYDSSCLWGCSSNFIPSGNHFEVNRRVFQTAFDTKIRMLGIWWRALVDNNEVTNWSAKTKNLGGVNQQY